MGNTAAVWAGSPEGFPDENTDVIRVNLPDTYYDEGITYEPEQKIKITATGEILEVSPPIVYATKIELLD